MKRMLRTRIYNLYSPYCNQLEIEEMKHISDVIAKAFIQTTFAKEDDIDILEGGLLIKTPNEEYTQEHLLDIRIHDLECISKSYIDEKLHSKAIERLEEIEDIKRYLNIIKRIKLI